MQLINNFHNTHVSVRPSAAGILSKRQAFRAWKVLCGIRGCTCGDILGTRGMYGLEVIPHQDGLVSVGYYRVGIESCADAAGE